jgi:hypothetical protein
VKPQQLTIINGWNKNTRVSKMLTRLIFFTILFFLNSQLSFAHKTDCSVEPKASDLRPAVEGHFIGETKSPLFSAPNRNCKLKGVYVAKDSYLTVYSYNQDWAYGMYVRGDEDFTGWLPMKSLKIIGPYGTGR